jgi:pilus assembly protein CpaE
MPPNPTVVLIGCRAETDILTRQLKDIAEIVAIEPNAALGAQAVQRHEPDLALLLLDHEPDAVLELTKQLSAQGDCVPVLISSDKSPDIIRRAMRAGARDIAFLDATDSDVARSVRELSAATAATAATRPSRGKVITVFGCKGGSGATTIALNLAGALLHADGDASKSVVVLDLDLEMGDVLVSLDLGSGYNYHDVVANMHRLDSDLLRTSLAAHKSGLYVLSQTDQLEDAPELVAEDLGKVIGFLKQHFDFVVIDGPRDFHDLALCALDRSDFIVCTMTQDVPALKNANRCLQIFHRLGYADQKVRLVINRYRGSGQLGIDAVSDALGRKVDGTVANDFPAVIKALNEGKLLRDVDPNSKVAKDVGALVGLVHQAAPAKKRGLFSRWGKR